MSDSLSGPEPDRPAALRLTPDQLERRKRFLDLGPEDGARLRLLYDAASGSLDDIVDRLYEHVLSFEETRSLFPSAGDVDHAREGQLRYFRELTHGPYDLAYAEDRIRIGAVHERMGLDVEYYIGAYCRYLREMAHPLLPAPMAPAEKLEVLESLLKVAFLDIGLAVDTYVFRREQELKAAIRELEAFNYSVSHDLRAPLRAIIGFSQALVEDAGDQLDEDSRSHLGFIVQGALRMSQLIEGLLRLSRVSNAEIQWQTLSLSDIAAAVAEPLLAAAARPVDLRVQPGITASGDARLVPVLLQNLLDNAFKFTSHHETAHVDVGVEERDGELAAFVRDDGAGFDMAHADRLFGTFQRLHLETEFEGTGIGLATVRRIVRRHDGRVWAESSPERGATFFFTLPDLRTR